jgi:hypothetical protein
MAHFAEVDAAGVVLRVLVVPDDQEHRGQEFMADDLGLGGTWIQTSYNTRGNVHYGADGEADGGTATGFNYAGVGFTWDGTGFAAPRPYPSWNLDASYAWQPPTPEPTTTRTVNHEGTDYEVPVRYRWDEDTTSWVEVEVES